MYRPTDKMCDLMGASGNNECFENQVLQLINRFGLPLGVGDKSIEAVCRENDVDCTTLLAVVNFATQENYHNDAPIDVLTLRRYLENAHTYFLEFQLPRIRQELLEAINLADSDTQIPLLIIRFFDEYVQEIRAHIRHEDEFSFEQHATDDQHVTAKAIELKNLIIKYYPHSQVHDDKSREQTRLLYAALHDIYHFESELALHCAIEDKIMIPALAAKEMQQGKAAESGEKETETDGLSAREKEVLVQVVKGLSNKEIADVLCLSAHTVMSHRKNIVRKLNIHSTAGLTIYAIVNGIVNLSDLESNL